jgi:hypothetical protein
LFEGKPISVVIKPSLPRETEPLIVVAVPWIVSVEPKGVFKSVSLITALARLYPPVLNSTLATVAAMRLNKSSN